MRRIAPPHVKLKAAGGVRTLDAMIEVAEIGCDRIGCVPNRRDPRRAQGETVPVKIGWLPTSGAVASAVVVAFDSGRRADDERVAEVQKQACLEHSGQALELTIKRSGVVDGRKPAVDDLVAAIRLVGRAIGQAAYRGGRRRVSATCARCASLRSD